MGRKDKINALEEGSTLSIGFFLRRARQEKGITLTEMGRLVDYSKGYLSGAENGIRPASRDLIERYEKALELQPGELSQKSQTRGENSTKYPLMHERVLLSSSQYWNIPHRRSQFFTGRESLLQRLHDILMESKSALLSQPLALSGLGGVGKTLIAIEYAYRYRDDYQAGLWIQGDTHEMLISAILAATDLLGLLEKDSNNQKNAMSAFKYWLDTNINWLLVFDNVEDLQIVSDFLPSKNNGHILITTRANATGNIAQPVEIEKLEAEDGALFLLRRAKFIAPYATLSRASEADRTKAKAISEELGGLPLALDQAGAYIEETKSSFSNYLRLYRTHRTDLLKRRGEWISDHPEPVSTTWELVFERLNQNSPAAIDLLKALAFLHADDIPEEIITIGASYLGPALKNAVIDSFGLDNIISILLKYSLIRRNPKTQILTVHRLVQAILKDSMDAEEQHQWAERIVRAVNHCFPSQIVTSWSDCQRYLSQAQVCAMLIDQWDIAFPEAAQLLHKTGCYLMARAWYMEAKPLLERALAIREKVLGHDHPDTATSLDDLGILLSRFQSKYTEAEPLLERALAIREKVLGHDHPDTATSLSNLVWLYSTQGKYDRVEPILPRALAVSENLQSVERQALLESIAQYYYNKDQSEKAEELYKQILLISEDVFGTEHPRTAENIINLAILYHDRKLYTQAELLYLQALAIYENVLGPEHPDTANCLDALARLYHAQGLLDQVEPLYRQALAIREKMLGPEHPSTTISLDSLAWLYQDLAQYEQAEALYLKALAIREKVQGPEHLYVAISCDQLAAFYKERGQNKLAELFYQRSLEIKMKVLGSKHARTGQSLHNLASFYRDQGQSKQLSSLSIYSDDL